MILAAIVYTEEEKITVDAFEALDAASQVSNYWSNPTIANLKSRIKTHYIAAQNARCCYCNRHQGSYNHRLWDVEHVASRAKHARFMFTPTNLAASCVDCNINKSEIETLVNPKRKTYPGTSAAFKIVHPHFDQFNDHIFLKGYVYLPKTEKGTATIHACNLLRFAQKFIAWENSVADSRFEAEVDAVFEEKPNVSKATVEEIIAQLPEK